MPPVRSFAQAPNPAEVARQEVEQLRQTLFDGKKPPRERDEAARRLLERGENQLLLDALRSGVPDLEAPVARAIAQSKSPPAAFLDDILRCFQPQITVELADAASLAAVNYRDNPAARARLRDFIQSINVSERFRVPAIRALGTLNDRDTAQFLMDVLRGPNAQLSDAAADALCELTGLTEYGRDMGQWERWWREQAGKSPDQFLAERRAEREGSARQATERLRQLATAIEDSVTDAHSRIANPADREADILRNLNHQLPEFRGAGARLVNQDLIGGLTISPAVKERLRDLIGDSSPDVRRRVAYAIAAVNDRGAAAALLAQLRREKIEAVKVALMQALAPTRDVAAVPDLVRLLDDPAFQVAEAAASALRELGPEIVKDQDLTHTVSNALARTIDRTRDVRGAERLREHTTEAMIALKDPALIQTLFTLLQSDRAENTPNTRNSAIRALAAMNVPPRMQEDIANQIANVALRDNEAGVRLEAAKALGIVGGPAQKKALVDAMGPNERDETVRDAAWKSLSSLFDQFDITELFNAAETFRGSPEKQLAVYLALNKKLIPSGGARAEERAVVQENIGALYLNPAINQPDKAATYLQGALNYWDAKGPGFSTENIQNNLVNAYLRGKNYKEAVDFAAQRINVNPRNQESMARAILQEVAGLNMRNQLQSALDLITEAKRLNIAGPYQDEIARWDKDIRARIVPFYWMQDWWTEYSA